MAYLALDALADDGAEDRPDVLLGLEVLLTVAAPMHAGDHAPVEERTEGHRGVAAADLEVRHDVVGAHRLARDVEQGVDLRHRSADAPDTAHPPPGLDEPLDIVLVPIVGGAGIGVVWGRAHTPSIASRGEESILFSEDFEKIFLIYL